LRAAAVRTVGWIDATLLVPRGARQPNHDEKLRPEAVAVHESRRRWRRTINWPPVGRVGQDGCGAPEYPDFTAGQKSTYGIHVLAVTASDRLADERGNR
jgi:hypothetical protein